MLELQSLVLVWKELGFLALECMELECMELGLQLNFSYGQH